MKKFAGGIIILHMCTKNHNHLMYESWDTEWDTIFLPFWTIFCPFTSPLMILHIKIMKKKCLDILSFYTYMFTINEDHMIYGSGNIRCDRQKFSTFWAISCPFSPLKTGKIKILTLKKTPGDIIILHICTTNDNHMMHSSWDIEHDRHNVLSFWTVFCPFTPLWTQNITIFKKMEKIPKDIIILQT